MSCVSLVVEHAPARRVLCCVRRALPVPPPSPPRSCQYSYVFPVGSTLNTGFYAVPFSPISQVADDAFVTAAGTLLAFPLQDNSYQARSHATAVGPAAHIPRAAPARQNWILVAVLRHCRALCAPARCPARCPLRSLCPVLTPTVSPGGGRHDLPAERPALRLHGPGRSVPRPGSHHERRRRCHSAGGEGTRRCARDASRRTTLPRFWNHTRRRR